MSVIKVNSQLYRTCRLCLEDMGQHHILPVIQEQIKYCFDINVEPFDGLPQLLCNKCEEILKDFYETKKRLVGKQDELIKGIYIKNTQNSDKTNTANQDDSENEPPKSTVAKRKQIVLSFSSSRSDQPSQCTGTENTIVLKPSASWQSNYNKEYVCRLCNYRGKKKQSVSRHTNSCHKKLKMQHQNVFKNQCMIKLDKLDKLPNLTGLDDMVVISGEKIVQDVDKNYFIVYTSKVSKVVEKNDKVEILDNDTVRKKQKISDDMLKSRIEEKQKDSICHTNNVTKETLNGDCIKIDDSSDSASENNINSTQLDSTLNNTLRSQKIALKPTIEDYHTKIQSIISMCYSKYKKNIDLHNMDKKQPSNPTLSKSQLKHKVLSIGRKIINKQGFNCTGLLRYMEHRNLEILWTPITSNYNTDTNYVRIMTKLSANFVDEDETGWKTCELKSKDHNYAIGNVTSDPHMPKISQVFYIDKNMSRADTKNKLLNKNPVANPKQMRKKTLVTEKHKDSVPVVLMQTCPNNEQPISKQKEASNAISMPGLNSQPIVIQQNCNNEQNNKTEHKENNILAHKENNILVQEENIMLPHQNIKNSIEPSAGKIKVKPLAELLSKEGPMNTFIIGNPASSQLPSQDKQSNMFPCINLNNFTQTCLIPQPSYTGVVSQAITASQIIQPSHTVLNHSAQTTYTVQAIPVGQPNVIIQMNNIDQPLPSNDTAQTVLQNQVQKNTVQLQSSCTPQANAEFVIMDTVELPSTKTNSPIQYLQNLLLLHDIYLLEQASHELSYMFACLIKFKVLYKQETMEEPILLSLSLYSHKNKFCMKVKNVHRENIDVSKISANWQWEIIKVFCGDVSNKLMQNAQKVNQETYDRVKTFLCLLKSIKYTKI